MDLHYYNPWEQKLFRIQKNWLLHSSNKLRSSLQVASWNINELSHKVLGIDTQVESCEKYINIAIQNLSGSVFVQANFFTKDNLGRLDCK